MNMNSAAWASAALTIVLLSLAGCAGNQTVAPIEGRSLKPEAPVVRPPPAPKPAPAPAPTAGGPIVRALPDVEPPGVRAIPIPEGAGGAVPLPPVGEATAPTRAPATAELIAKADQLSAQGQYDTARANLERAVKISPRDAELWQRLATVSYAQGDYAQAKSLAERSNSFAAPGSALASRNWMLIGNAELKLGNQSAASAAFERSGATPP